MLWFPCACFVYFVTFFVVSTIAINCRERFVSQVTYYVLSGTSNLLFDWLSPSVRKWRSLRCMLLSLTTPLPVPLKQQATPCAPGQTACLSLSLSTDLRFSKRARRPEASQLSAINFPAAPRACAKREQINVVAEERNWSDDSWRVHVDQCYHQPSASLTSSPCQSLHVGKPTARSLAATTLAPSADC